MRLGDCEQRATDSATRGSSSSGDGSDSTRGDDHDDWTAVTVVVVVILLCIVVAVIFAVVQCRNDPAKLGGPGSGHGRSIAGMAAQGAGAMYGQDSPDYHFVRKEAAGYGGDSSVYAIPLDPSSAPAVQSAAGAANGRDSPEHHTARPDQAGHGEDGYVGNLSSDDSYTLMRTCGSVRGAQNEPYHGYDGAAGGRVVTTLCKGKTPATSMYGDNSHGSGHHGLYGGDSYGSGSVTTVRRAVTSEGGNQCVSIQQHQGTTPDSGQGGAAGAVAGRAADAQHNTRPTKQSTHSYLTVVRSNVADTTTTAL